MVKALTFAIFCSIIEMVEIISYSWLKTKYKRLKGVAYMYNVGDKVVYAMHGAGVIDSIE